MFGLEIRKLFNRDRFFIVNYVATGYSAKHITGSMEFRSDNRYIRESVAKQLINKANGDGICDIVITNIIELSKSDFKDWNPKSSLIN